MAGEIDDLRYFITHRLLGNEQLETANLNYWAYWIGEAHRSGPARRDDFMATGDLGNWHGGALLDHLSSRLLEHTPHLDLTVHSLWALITYRPRLLMDDPVATTALNIRSAQLLDSHNRENLSARAIQEIDQLTYATRLAKGMTR